MLTANHKFTNVSNGNQVYVSDLAAMAQNAVNLFSALPLRTFDEPVIMGDFKIDYEVGGAPVLYSFDGQGAVFLCNKIFGLNSGGIDVSIPKGTYLYGLAVANTTQPRVSSTGINYSQFIDYSLQLTTTPRTDVTSDITAQTGVFELINGAATAAMTDGQYISALKYLLTVWNTTDNIQYDYVVDSTTTLERLSNNSNATNVLILAGNYSITSPIILNPATKRITAQAGAVVTATFATLPQAAFGYATAPTTDDYSISGLTVVSNGYAFSNCRNVSNCIATRTRLATHNYPLFINCANLDNCTANFNGVSVYGAFSSCNNLKSCQVLGNAVPSSTITLTAIAFQSCNRLWACNANISMTTAGTLGETLTGFIDCNFITSCNATITAPNAIIYGFVECQYLTNTTTTMNGASGIVHPYDQCGVMFGNNSNMSWNYPDCYMDLTGTNQVGPTATGGYNF